jgi:hypothetical protein
MPEGAGILYVSYKVHSPICGLFNSIYGLVPKVFTGRVVHCDTIRATFDILKARMTYAHVLLISKSDIDAEFILTADTSKIGIAGVLLQEFKKTLKFIYDLVLIGLDR